MRQGWLALLAAFLCVPLLGANTALSAPVVVVYNYAGTAGLDADAGAKIAIFLATELAQSGDLVVKPATPGTDRAHYLDAARTQGANYYVTGYLAPLGNEVSLVSQVVTVDSGILVWSATEEIRTYGEATGQADAIRAAILRHAGRALASLDKPPPSTSAPQNKQEQGNLAQALGHRTHRATTVAPAPPRPDVASAGTNSSTTPPPSRQQHHRRAHVPAAAAPPEAALTPAPQHRSHNRRHGSTPEPASTIAVVAGAETSPVARAAPPASPAPVGTILVVPIGGDAALAQRAYASTVLTNAMQQAGVDAALSRTFSSADVVDRAERICTRGNGTEIYTGVLSLQFAGGGAAHGTAATFDLTRYDCKGNVLATEHAETLATGANDINVAIDRAVASTLPAVMHPPRRRRR